MDARDLERWSRMVGTSTKKRRRPSWYAAHWTGNGAPAHVVVAVHRFRSLADRDTFCGGAEQGAFYATTEGGVLRLSSLRRWSRYALTVAEARAYQRAIAASGGPDFDVDVRCLVAIDGAGLVPVRPVKP